MNALTLQLAERHPSTTHVLSVLSAHLCCCRLACIWLICCSCSAATCLAADSASLAADRRPAVVWGQTQPAHTVCKKQHVTHRTHNLCTQADIGGAVVADSKDSPGTTH